MQRLPDGRWRWVHTGLYGNRIPCMVCHLGLSAKLEHANVGGKCLDLFRSYLTNRQQVTVVDGCKSEVRTITAGIPQGSKLGPLLFILYSNDIQKIYWIRYFTLFWWHIITRLKGSSIKKIIVFHLKRLNILCLRSFLLDKFLKIFCCIYTRIRAKI